MAERKEVKGEVVANDQKLFSIYELHTDIIVKGGRDIQFVHKIKLSIGQSNLISTCEVCEVLNGNPQDCNLFKSTLDKVEKEYETIPRDSVTNGGYAPKENLKYAQNKEIASIVFNKIVGGLRHVVSSRNMETRLKK